ncbi:hypothetical protein A5638_14840 [Mycolicibacterium fortuitum]|nr:hypothetical protein A5638_14840 [Mycolicibacterium fortuitum]
MTGESRRYLLNSDVLDDDASIPFADTEQALFEALVMRAVMDSQGWLAHPLGVSHIRLPRRGGFPMVHIDPPTSGDPIDETMAHNLLPVRTPDGEAMGVPGLRLLGAAGKDLQLGMAGSKARLALRAHVGWRRWLAQWSDTVIANGGAPLFKDFDELTAAEQSWLSAEQRRLAWLGSSLLRRIGIFHQVSVAYGVRGWVSDDRWKVELTINPTLDPGHDEFIATLTDPAHGIPLLVESRSCSCEMNGPYGPGSRRDCWFELAPRDVRVRGGLQLRFRMSTPNADWSSRFAAAGADPRWLARTGLQ